MEAFKDIILKFEKVSDEKQIAHTFRRDVERSYFTRFEKVLTLKDTMESMFTKSLANNVKNKTRRFLRPQQQPKKCITFLIGLFTSSFVLSIIVHAAYVRMFDLDLITHANDYFERIYPIYCIFVLVSLHIFFYGCNILAWRHNRINHNYILDLSPNSALKHRDAFLISTFLLMVTSIGLLAHFILLAARANKYIKPIPSVLLEEKYIDCIPRVLVLILIVLLIFPTNLFYGSTRFYFGRTMLNILLSLAPSMKMSTVEMLMTDQLTSQIPLIGHLLWYCMVFRFEMVVDSSKISIRTQHYKNIAFCIFFPYLLRLMQCVYRAFKPFDKINAANAGKFSLTLLAIILRWKYMMMEHKNPTLFTFAILTSVSITIYQLYWDFVRDWGLLDFQSPNRFLRDKLILKRKSYYYGFMGLNLILRFTWILNLIPLELSQAENQMINFLLASLEIIRRAIWNFYRLENLHFQSQSTEMTTE